MNCPGAGGGGARAHRGAREPSRPVAKRLEVDFSILGLEQCTENDDFAGEFATEEVGIVAFDAGMQVGKRISLNVVGAALKVQRHGVWHDTWNEIARKRYIAIRFDDRVGLERARGKFERHRRRFLPVTVECQRHLAHDLVGVGNHVERPDVLLLPDRDPLARGGAIAAQRLAQHELAGGGGGCESTQEGPVEAAHSYSQRVIAERNFGLFDRGRKHDIEADNSCAAVDDRCQNLADLRRPGQGWGSLEGGRLVGFLVDRDHCDGLGRGIASGAEDFPPQRRQDVDRPAMKMADGRKCGKQPAGQRREDDRDGVSSCVAHVGVRATRARLISPDARDD